MPHQLNTNCACEICGKGFHLPPSRLLRGQGRFCSRDCKHVAQSGPQTDFATRFWAKVRKAGPDDCWEWIASRHTWGYGQIGTPGSSKPIYAHRVSWEFTHGAIPDGLFVLHSCDNPPCVNPRHLHLGTHDENMAEMRERKRGVEGAKRRFREHPETHPRHIDPTPSQGENNPAAQLTEDAVRNIRSDYSTGQYRYTDLALKYGVSLPAIAKVVTRRTWQHVS